MHTYYVTFRIANKTAAGKSYEDRRQALVDNVRSEGQGYWDETTSFFLVESIHDTDKLSANACKGLSSADDMVVVIDPSDKSACYFGPVQALDVLKSFFPKLKKVP